MNINATDLRVLLGDCMQIVYKEPVIVEKHGKPAMVLISFDAYERLSQLEDFYWGMKANDAIKNGFLGAEESERKLSEYAKKAGITVDDKASAN